MGQGVGTIDVIVSSFVSTVVVVACNAANNEATEKIGVAFEKGRIRDSMLLANVFESVNWFMEKID